MGEGVSKIERIKDQIQRAVISIASNIAEGFERKSTKEFIRFLYIAKGSRCLKSIPKDRLVILSGNRSKWILTA